MCVIEQVVQSFNDMAAKVLAIILTILRGTTGLGSPSYVSEWLWMDVNNYTTTDVTLNHTFGVRPVKAEVQVKSPNTNFTYPGVKSAHSQNEDGERGGVICLYGENTVRLLGATNQNSSSTNRAYIIYTGNTTWTTDNGEALEAAWVRVRLWNTTDLPSPNFTITTVMSAGGVPNYLNISHNLGVQPILTVVQYYSTDTNSYFSTMVAEAQGTNAIQINASDSDSLESSFVFAVSSSDIRLWAADESSGITHGIFSFCKGWGHYTASQSECFFREAHVDISIWTEIEDWSMDTQGGSIRVTNNSPRDYSFEPFNATDDLVIVTSSPRNGDNSQYEFDGTGAAMTDGIANSAGLIYAYNEDGRVRLWNPRSSHCIVQVGPGMGNGTYNECVDNVWITVTIWRTGCAWIEVENAVATGDLFNMSYVCNNGSEHLSGDLERTCQATFTWNGTLPVCGRGCPWVEVENAVATGTDAMITYECDAGSIHASGDLVRTCDEQNNTWNGTEPVCLKCAPLEAGLFVIVDFYLLATQRIANFTCVDGYSFLSGKLTRNCVLPDGNWTGTPPICGANTTTSTTTTAATTALSTVSSVVEVCFNFTNVVYNETTLQKQTEEIIANLTIDVKSTSKFERSRTSAKDSRASSKYIGLVGYLIFGLIGGIIVIPDFLSALRYVLVTRRNIVSPAS